MLDTVFVVADSQPLERAGVHPDSDLPDLVRCAVAQPLSRNPGSTKTFRPYRGATVDQRANCCYSFVPALPTEHGASFGRTALSLTELNLNLAMGTRQMAEGPQPAQAIWRQVREQVLDHDLVCGTHLATPAGAVPGGAPARQKPAARRMRC